MAYPRLTFLLFIALSAALFSCKKSSQEPAPVVYGPEKTITLNSSTNPSAVDTLFVKRDKSTATLQVKAKTSGADMKRLYIFKRFLDDINTPGSYATYMGSGFEKDGNDQYYYKVPDNQTDSIAFSVTVDLRANTPAAIMDEFYFVFTDDNDFGGPASSSGVILGPAQFFIIYGKLTETIGIKIYNQYNNKSYASGLDIVTFTYKAITDAAADIDVSENTDDNALFIATFKSLNGTTFVKAPPTFNYANATDTRIGYTFSQGTPFTVTPSAVAIGDVYLIKLRGTDQYAALKVLYVAPESGTTGAGNDNEFISFALKK